MKHKELERKSIEYRKTILEIIYHSGAGHTGGSLSCIDILNVLYNGIMNITPENFSSFDRDHFIQITLFKAKVIQLKPSIPSYKIVVFIVKMI